MKDKFGIGQVVAVCPDGHERPAFGRVISQKDHEGRYMLEFWDFDNSDIWRWDYPEKDLRALSIKERGAS